VIKRIRINYFQSHKRTVLHLSPGVNILYGLSMSGKTSVIRALKWLALNRPISFNKKSHFAAKHQRTEVSAVFDTGTCKIYNDGKTHYQIKGVEYSALKGNVPDEVKEQINMGEINFSYQFADPFLVNQPSAMAREINRITNQEEITGMMQIASRKIRDTGKKIETLEDEQYRIGVEIKKLMPSRLLHPIIIKARKKEERLKAIEEELEEIVETKEDVENRKQIVKKTKHSIRTLKRIKRQIETLLKREEEIEEALHWFNEIKARKKLIASAKIAKKQLEKEYIRTLGSKCKYCMSTIDKKRVEEMLEKI
jgi:exonuclease SbcC